MSKTFLLICFIFCSGITMAQTTKEKIEKAHNHPAREKNAARADVYVAEKKVITDTSQNSALLIPHRRNEKMPTKKKSKNCSRHSSKKS